MFLFAIALVAAVAGQGLDAPIDQHPTVRSEIQRGYEAGAACDDFRASAHTLDPCIGRILTENRVTHPTSDAFAIGLNVHKWILGARYVSVAHDLPGNSLAQDFALYGKISAGDAEIAIEEGIAKLNISLDQAFEAAGVIQANRPASVLH